MIKNSQFNLTRSAKSYGKRPYSKNTLKEFKKTEKEEDLDIDQQSVKKMSQYEALAIKLGLMPKKVKSSNPHLEKQPKKMAKTHTTRTQSDFSTQSSKITQKQNAKFFTNRPNQSYTPILGVEQKQFQNPFKSLHDNYVARSSVNCLQNKSELENIYKKYLSESQINNIQNKTSLPAQDQIMNKEMIRTQKTISRLQVHLNLLINKYSKEI